MRLSLLALAALALVAAAASVSAHFAEHPLSKVHIENIKVAPASGTITIDAPSGKQQHTERWGKRGSGAACVDEPAALNSPTARRRHNVSLVGFS